MTSVLDLSKCIPTRNQSNWELLEKRNRKNEFRKNQPRDRRNLPLSILVKIRGPPKIVDSYKIQVPNNGGTEKPPEMFNGASCTPLNITPFQDKFEEENKKKGVVLLRPALQQCKQIPGRYFPKPTLTEEQQRMLLTGKDSPRPDTIDKSRTETCISSSSSKVSKSISKASVSSRGKRPDFSNSVNPRIFHTRKTLFDKPDSRPSLFTISFRGQEDLYDPRSEIHSDYYTLKRVGSVSRQVTFPNKSDQFREMLTGTTKTLHQRKFLLSAPSGGHSDDKAEPTDVST